LVDFIEADQIFDFALELGIDINRAILDHNLFLFVEDRENKNSGVVHSHVLDLFLEIKIKRISEYDGFVCLETLFLRKFKLIQELE
jgi:hypothetical protein